MHVCYTLVYLTCGGAEYPASSGKGACAVFPVCICGVEGKGAACSGAAQYPALSGKEEVCPVCICGVEGKGAACSVWLCGHGAGGEAVFPIIV